MASTPHPKKKKLILRRRSTQQSQPQTKQSKQIKKKCDIYPILQSIQQVRTELQSFYEIIQNHEQTWKKECQQILSLISKIHHTYQKRIRRYQQYIDSTEKTVQIFHELESRLI